MFERFSDVDYSFLVFFFVVFVLFFFRLVVIVYGGVDGFGWFANTHCF